MKKVFTMLVGVAEAARLEKYLNTFRIGLHDWDKTKVLTIQGMQVINYTIICAEEEFVDITTLMNGTRVY